MATELDTLVVKLSADVSGLQGEMKKANDAVAKAMVDAQKRFDTAKKAASDLGDTIKNALGAALAGLSVKKLVDMARDTGAWAQELENTARTLGLTTDAVQELDYAATKLGVSTGAVRNGISDLVVKFQEAKAGSDDMRALFNQIFNGESLNNIKTTEQLLAKVAENLKQFSAADQLTIAKRIAGKSGEELLTVIRQLQELRTESHEVGAVVDRELVASWARFSREIGTAAQQIDTAFKSALIAIEPIILKVANAIRDVVQFIGQIPRAIRGLRVEEYNRLGNEVDRLKDKVEGWAQAYEDMPTEWNKKHLESAKRELAEITKLHEDSFKALNRIDVGPASEPDKPPTRRFTDPGKGKQLDDMLRAANAELAVMRAELDGGKLAAEWEKIAQSLDKVGAGDALKDKFRDIFDSSKATQFELSLKGITQENDKQEKILQAIISGNRDLIPLIEAQYDLERQFGPLKADQLEKLQAVIAGQTELNKRIERAKASSAELEKTFDSLAGTFQSAFVDSIFDSANAWEIWQKAGVDAVKAVINEMILLSVINPLKNSLFGQNNPTIGDVGGIVGSLFGSTATGTAGGFAGFAEGGNVSGGVPIIVGEKGPELWVPPSAGNIISNDNLRSSGGMALGGGGANVEVVVNNYGEERATVNQKRGAGGMQQIEVIIGQAGAKDVRTGGPMSRAFESTYGLKRSGTTR